MAITLTQKHLEIIYQHGQKTYPEECCGIILGKMHYNQSTSEKTAIELIPTKNVWSVQSAAVDFGETGENSRTRRYAIAPEVMLQTQKTARDRALNIIGIYHSHPDYPATPSEFDRHYAWSTYSYIIVSIQQAKPSQIYSWCLDDHDQFQPEPIHIITSENTSELEGIVE